jgi:hypothetical protein
LGGRSNSQDGAHVDIINPREGIYGNALLVIFGEKIKSLNHVRLDHYKDSRNEI